MQWPIGWTSLNPLNRKSFKKWRRNLHWWCEEPLAIPRTIKVSKDRVNRLKALGNGQVPAAMVLAWRILSHE